MVPREISYKTIYSKVSSDLTDHPENLLKEAMLSFSVKKGMCGSITVVSRPTVTDREVKFSEVIDLDELCISTKF